MYASCKICKKTHWNTSFFVFFTTLDPKDYTYFTFLADFQWNMLGDTIHINNLCCNPVILKKNWQNLSKIVFWTQFAQKRDHHGPRPKWKKLFLEEITKRDDQLSESFYFIKISYVLTEL